MRAETPRQAPSDHTLLRTAPKCTQTGLGAVARNRTVADSAAGGRPVRAIAARGYSGHDNWEWTNRSALVRLTGDNLAMSRRTHCAPALDNG